MTRRGPRVRDLLGSCSSSNHLRCGYLIKSFPVNLFLHFCFQEFQAHIVVVTGFRHPNNTSHHCHCASLSSHFFHEHRSREPRAPREPREPRTGRLFFARQVQEALAAQMPWPRGLHVWFGREAELALLAVTVAVSCRFIGWQKCLADVGRRNHFRIFDAFVHLFWITQARLVWFDSGP